MPTHTEQVDLLDSAPRERVGDGGIRCGKTLRTLIQAGVLELRPDGQITVTENGRRFLAALRNTRGRI